MHWKEWLLTMCPEDWTNEEALEFINIKLHSITMEQVIEVRQSIND